MANTARLKTVRHTGVAVTWTALSTSGVPFDFEGKDFRTAILITNTSADTADAAISVVAGNSFQGCQDIAIPSLAAGATMVLALDSGEFKNVSGTAKGGIVIKGASTTKAAVVELVE